jgi:hypothetical protein
VAVVVSIARGHDAAYPFKTIGTADGAEFGSFHDGDAVQREDFESRYAQFPDPRAGSGLAAFAIESGFNPRFGLECSYRAASKGRMIAGFPETVIAQFSARRAQIARTTLALAEEHEKERGHAPDKWELATTRQFAYAMSRRCKGLGALDFARLLREWEQSSRGAELGTLRDLARTVWYAAPGGGADARVVLARMATRLASRRMLMLSQECAAMAAPLAQTHESLAAWSRADLIHCVGPHPSNEACTAPYIPAEQEVVIAERLGDSGAGLGPAEDQISSWDEANHHWNGATGYVADRETGN